MYTYSVSVHHYETFIGTLESHNPTLLLVPI